MKTTTLDTEFKLLDIQGRKLNLYNWEVEVLNDLEKRQNIKKIWFVHNTRKIGTTYFSKLLLFFRPPCDRTFVISHNLYHSKYISRQMPIKFPMINSTKDPDVFTSSNFLTPVTLFSLEQEINKIDDYNKAHFECLYDGVFNVEKYNALCSYDFDLLIISISSKDLEKALPFIEQDKDKEDVYIKYIK